jgi:hypothetical protein
MSERAMHLSQLASGQPVNRDFAPARSVPARTKDWIPWEVHYGSEPMRIFYFDPRHRAADVHRILTVEDGYPSGITVVRHQGTDAATGPAYDR